MRVDIGWKATATAAKRAKRAVRNMMQNRMKLRLKVEREGKERICGSRGLREIFCETFNFNY